MNTPPGPSRISFLDAGRALIVGAALLLTAGCASYHCGSLMHPQFKTVAVGDFYNKTEEAGLTVCLRQGLAEAFMTDGSLKLASLADADAVVQGRILQYQTRSIGFKYIGDNDPTSDYRNTYQSSLYQIEVIVEFEVIIPDPKRPVLVLDKRTVRGIAEFGKLPDQTIARDEALRRATRDAAQQVAAAVTEGW